MRFLACNVSSQNLNRGLRRFRHASELPNSPRAPHAHPREVGLDGAQFASVDRRFQETRPAQPSS
eukprot:2559252-Prymnesium_polylepis.1